ncbi:hypothetical protein [Saccharopolyspora cebuensis]
MIIGTRSFLPFSGPKDLEPLAFGAATSMLIRQKMEIREQVFSLAKVVE